MTRLLLLTSLLWMLAGCLLGPPREIPPTALWGIGGVTLPGHAARQSTWDRTGGNYDNVQVRPGETVTLFDAEGPGIIRHLWLTTNATGPIGRTVTLRMFWDGSTTPAVEVPLGDFFGAGHGLQADVDSFPITVTSRGRARNAWWPMPFADGARITVTNEGPQTHGALYCHVDWLALDAPPPTRQRFHARYSQAHPADAPENFLFLETEGRGNYVGVIFSVESTEPHWWGEGDELIEADDHEPIRGTGAEDYFGDAWATREYSRLWHGTTISEGYDAVGQRTTLFRFHVLDPIPFEERLRVSIEHGSENERADNLSSVALWYQESPATPGAPLPPVVERLVGEDQQEFIRMKAWQLATSDDADALAALGPHADETNALLLDGLTAYVRGKANPTDAVLVALEAPLGRIEAMIEAMPEEERFVAAEIDVLTDADADVPARPLRTRTTLERARHDLARRVALARDHLAPGDEILVEVRDAKAALTPPPAFEATEDWEYSYAKVEDPHLMGAGAHFTLGATDPSWARFTPDFPQGGRFEVLVTFSYGSNAGDTRYEVRHADGLEVVPLAQRGRVGTPDRNNAVWHSLGTHRFAAGQSIERGSVTLNTAPGVALPHDLFQYRAYADAVRFVFVGD